MADLSVTAAQVERNSPAERTWIKPYIAAATITAGQSLYLNSSGKVDLCDANASGKEQFAGIALNGAAAGQAVDVLYEGEVAGFDLSGVAYGALVYQGDTAGALADAASATKTITVGRVVPKSDSSLTKSLQIRASVASNF